MNIVVGYILTFLGGSGLFYSFVTIKTDHSHTWRSPFTTFETTIMVVCILSLIVLVAGIMIIIFSVVKKKNQDMLNKLSGTVDNEPKASVCPNCGLNVSPNLKQCPRCNCMLSNNRGVISNGKNNY